MTLKIFVVTGANKGIGRAIVESLLQKTKDSIIYLTARNVNLGEQTFTAIKASAKYDSELRFHQLDITDDPSCCKFADYLKATHDGIDVLINNAGIAFKNNATEPPEVQAKATIDVNYYGTKRISNYLMPLIRPGGRIVNVCSMMGLMKGVYSDERIRQLRDAQSTDDIDSFVEDYIMSAKNNTRKQDGFPESAYRVSKAAEIALTMQQAKMAASRNIIVNACCPGFVSTDMTSHKGYLTTEQGADTPVFLAVNESVQNAAFVEKREVSEWP